MTYAQTDLFSYAEAARNVALDRVEENADDGWLELAFDAIERTARIMPEFISDDVWEVADLPRTRELRALGPVFLRAARAGLIRKTDRVRPSVRSHLSGKPVWHSLVYQDAA